MSAALTVGSELLVDEDSAPAPPPVFDAGVALAPVLVLLDVAVSGSALAVLDWLDVLLAGVLGSALLDDVLVSVAVLLAGLLELELTVLLEALELVAGSSLVAGVVGSAGLAGSSGVASGMSS